MNFFANTGAVQLSIRGASEADLDRLVEIHLACYPDDRTGAQRRTSFTTNPFGRFEDLRIAEHAGRIVGHGFGFQLRAHFGGQPAPIVGIASVGVAPEARGAGVGAAIVAHIEEEARARGASIALLHAFRHGFYAKRGYADVSPMRRLWCDARAVPRAWVADAGKAPLRAATGDDVTPIAQLHARAITSLTGCIDRPESLWTRLFASERLHVVVLEGAGGLAGYVMFELVQRESHAKTRLEVRDLFARDDDARRTLWGFLGMQAGQVAEVIIEVSEDDPIAFALTDIDGHRFGDDRVEHALGSLVAGPMVRLLDVQRALGARGYDHDGVIDLVVSAVPIRLTVQGGRATVGAHDGGAPSSLTTDARTLASIAFGGLRAQGAARLGLLAGDADAIDRADEVLRIAPFVTLDRF